MTRRVDLRSDTVTMPTPAMREAMYRAEIGDDVFGEDPTVNRLEAMAAAVTGKAAAVLLTSGTQGNLCGVLAHCQRGEEVIVGDQAHVFHSEAAGCAVVGGLQLRTVPNGKGMPSPSDVEGAIRPKDVHQPRTACISLENTHNRCGGTVFSAEDMGHITSIARRHNIPVHLDGARVFNAAVVLGVPVSDLVREVDSLTFCLSKGLAAPVGAILCGSTDLIARARRLRKMLGSGMRQAGIIAAAGIVALETMVERLADDHQNARLLAEGLAEIPGLRIDLSRVQSNLVFCDLAPEGPTSAQFAARLAEEGVRCSIPGIRRVRMVTHYGITADDIRIALSAVSKVLTN